MPTLFGFDYHDLVDFVHRHQGTCSARMARLTTTTALTPRAPQTLGPRRITRWGAGRILRGLVQLFLQRADLFL